MVDLRPETLTNPVTLYEAGQEGVVIDDVGDARVALVTGAARGIGRAISRRLAAEGRAVGVLDRNHDEVEALAAELRAEGYQALALTADVANSAEVTAAVAELVERLGPPTILVNNAGILRDNLLFRMTEDDWDQIMDVHLKGHFLVTRAVQQHMVDADWGRIVNLSSTSATGNRGQANYSAAKAGIQGFTKTLALELGRFGITANCVAPGYIDTDLTRQTAARLGMPFEEFMKEMAAQTAVGRTGTPDDIAEAVAFFTGERSGFITGQVLYAAGTPHV